MDEVERRIDQLAVAQERVASREQLLQAGLGHGALAYRVSTGRIRRLYHGVYLLGYGRPTFRQWLWAAVLFAGPGAVLSHKTAAGLWGLLALDEREIHVSLPARSLRPRRGVKIHRIRIDLDPDRTTLRGLPVTKPLRTLCDIAASEPIETAEEALTEALVHRQVRAPDARVLRARLQHHPGAARLRTLIAAEREHGYSRSTAERRLRALLKPSGLPMPRFNVRLHGHLVDCLWAREKLILEVDGYRSHGNRRSFEGDRRRDQDHVARGYRVIRITWRQLTEEPARVLVRIAAALATA